MPRGIKRGEEYVVPLPERLSGLLLIGWMKREEAIKYLQEECAFDPPLEDAEAEHCWAEYRDRVNALEERDACEPKLVAQTKAEQKAASDFLQKMPRPNNIVRIAKIDPRDLVVHQLVVVQEIS